MAPARDSAHMARLHAQLTASAELELSVKVH